MTATMIRSKSWRDVLDRVPARVRVGAYLASSTMFALFVQACTKGL